MSNPMRIGQIAENLLISERKYNFLKTHENTLSEIERAQVEAFEKARLENASKVFEHQVVEKPKPKKKLEKLPTKFILEKYKMIFEKQEGKKLLISDSNKQVIIDLANYFGRQKGNLDLNKGILILGGTGTGKSSMMRTFHTIGQILWHKHNEPIMNFEWHDCIKMVREFEDLSTDKTVFFQNHRGFIRMYDDLGQEKEASRFGLSNVMKEVLELRYHNLKNRTFMTSNLTGEEIKNKYGFRIHSRIYEMFNIVILNGQDYRIGL